MSLKDVTEYVPVRHTYVGGTKWNFMKWADIPDARDPKRVYLRRLRIVQTPWFALYLHFIYLPDDDRDPHDHPFNFWSLIVRGGYVERLWRIRPGVDKANTVEVKSWPRWSFHKMGQDWAHMIDHLTPGTITLVFCGPKTSNWGFYTQQGYKTWQAYNREKFTDDDGLTVDEFA